MARDDSGDRLLWRVALMSFLDGARPSGTLEWVSPVIPVVTQAAAEIAAGSALVVAGASPSGPVPGRTYEFILVSRCFRRLTCFVPGS